MSDFVWCSKTYCGYCSKVKQLLSQLQAAHKVIELDEEGELQQHFIFDSSFYFSLSQKLTGFAICFCKAMAMKLRQLCSNGRGRELSRMCSSTENT